jgi:formate hydrogenlyase subunit 3/multisubunit Na+/H+ antiporter MnhD subunit
MKPSSRLKSVTRHTIVWIIWFGLHSYTLFTTDIAKFGELDWLYHTFNFLSILIVFYPAAYFMGPILYRIFNDEYSHQDEFSDFRQIVNVETVSIVLLLVLYVILGVSMDALYNGYKYPGIDAYVYGRVEQVLPYMVYAACYALYRINKKARREKSSIKTEDETANEMT